MSGKTKVIMKMEQRSSKAPYSISDKAYIYMAYGMTFLLLYIVNTYDATFHHIFGELSVKEGLYVFCIYFISKIRFINTQIINVNFFYFYMALRLNM